jgi:hypothetical protein
MNSLIEIPDCKMSVSNHPIDGSPIMRITFANGWGLSILSSSLFYSSGDGTTFEVAILDANGDIDYSLHGDVLGYQTVEEIHKVAKQVAAL